jgi:tetratricopeptide (TPR) repeat protein
MPRHPTARRVHRQPAADDDTFVAGVLETTAWARTHRRTLIAGGIAVAAAAAFLFFFLSSRASKREQAAEQLTQVRAVALSGNTQLAIRDLERYVARFDGTPPAAEARLLLARSYLQAGQPQRAIEAVRGQARELDNVMGVNAAFLLAAAHEAAQESQRAEEVYLRIADSAEFLFQKQEALDNAARLRLDRGDAAGAAELYDRILALTPETDGSRQVYELRAAEARAAAGAAAPVTSPPGN